MYEIEHLRDSETVVKNKFFNNIQCMRCDLDIMLQSKKDYQLSQDDLKVVQALNRDFERLYKKQRGE